MKKPMKATEQLREIVDVFSGADGGGKFVMLLSLVREMERRSLMKGDAAADQILTVVARFHKLIEIANRGPHGQDD